MTARVQLKVPAYQSACKALASAKRELVELDNELDRISSSSGVAFKELKMCEVSPVACALCFWPPIRVRVT